MKPNNQSDACIGIVGLGLIGGSLGLDLQKLGCHVKGLTNKGITAQKARDRKLATEISTDSRILVDCDLVILALPLDQLIHPEQSLIAALPESAVITDVGSVKGPVLKIWRELHPRFVGSHPMAGNAKAGVEAGQIGLFQNRPWIATPEERTDPYALSMVKELALSLNCDWVTAHADLHDEAVALISHLPIIISAALLRTVGKEPNQQIKELAQKLASSGFADTTRIGGGNPQLGASMASSNSAAILHGLSSYRYSLELLEKAILQGNWPELKKELELTKALRPNFLNSQNQT